MLPSACVVRWGARGRRAVARAPAGTCAQSLREQRPGTAQRRSRRLLSGAARFSPSTYVSLGFGAMKGVTCAETDGTLDPAHIQAHVGGCSWGGLHSPCPGPLGQRPHGLPRAPLPTSSDAPQPGADLMVLKADPWRFA